MVYFIGSIKLSNLTAYLAKHRLRPVRLERWRERGLLLWTEKVKDATSSRP